MWNFPFFENNSSPTTWLLTSNGILYSILVWSQVENCPFLVIKHFEIQGQGNSRKVMLIFISFYIKNSKFIKSLLRFLGLKHTLKQLEKFNSLIIPSTTLCLYSKWDYPGLPLLSYQLLDHNLIAATAYFFLKVSGSKLCTIIQQFRQV